MKCADPEHLRLALAKVRLLVSDVDGVLTDGVLHYGGDGEVLKNFHVRDGLGIRLLRESEVEFAVISARSSSALSRRMRDLAVHRAHFGVADKGRVLRTLMSEIGCQKDEVLFIGDDLVDIPAMTMAGLAVAVADAHTSVRAIADWVTDVGGGQGAIREVADAVLAARGLMDQAIRTCIGEPYADALAARRQARDRRWQAYGEQAGVKFRVVIPARYGSTRLPGKPLRELAGKPMIAHVWDRAQASGADEVLVATDDERIAAAVAAFAGQSIMTSAGHRSGTERLAEVAELRDWDDNDIVVNLQGDEPCMPSEHLSTVARALVAHDAAGIATLAAPIDEVDALFDDGVVKVIMDAGGMAQYFSRAPIPWVRGLFATDGQRPDALPSDIGFWRHIGVYAYRVATLKRIAALEAVASERAESLEQLRALSAGIGIHVSQVTGVPDAGVDTEADLLRVEALLKGYDDEGAT